MSDKSVGFKILCWAEMIVSLRVLLFVIPVLINVQSAGSFSVSDPTNQFMIILTTTAVLYFFVGLLSLVGNRLWQAAHLMAVVLVFLVTAASVKISGQLWGGASAHYSAPLFFAVIVTVLAGILGKTKKVA